MRTPPLAFPARLRLPLLAAAVLAAAGLVHAAEEAGTVKTSKGSATVERDGQKLPATVGTPVFASDRLVTGADGAIGVTLRDSTLLSAGPNSVVEIQRFAYNSTTNAGTLHTMVKRGTLSVVSGRIARTTPDGVRFSTPATTMGVRGTEFVIDAGDGAGED